MITQPIIIDIQITNKNMQTTKNTKAKKKKKRTKTTKTLFIKFTCCSIHS
jgi:hypothetical protein